MKEDYFTIIGRFELDKGQAMLCKIIVNYCCRLHLYVIFNTIVNAIQYTVYSTLGLLFDDALCFVLLLWHYSDICIPLSVV